MQAEPNIVQQIAQATIEFVQWRTGHKPKSVSVVLSDDSLVIKLKEDVSRAIAGVAERRFENTKSRDMAKPSPAYTAETLQQEIERVTGMKLQDASAEVETTSGTVVRLFRAGTRAGNPASRANRIGQDLLHEAIQVK